MSTAILSARAVSALKDDGVFAVGGVPGLCIRIRGGSRTWILRYRYAGKRSTYSLGSCSIVSLAAARERARELAARVLAGDDIAAAKIAEQQALILRRQTMSFEAVATAWIENKKAHGGYRKNPRAEQSTRSRLRRSIIPLIGKIDISELSHQHVFLVLRPIWLEHPAESKALRILIRQVLVYAEASGLCKASTATDTRGPLGVLLAQLGQHRREKRHHPALDWREIPAFMKALHARPYNSARFLEFSILTASRAKQVREARWEDIDLEARTWRCPEASMKMKSRGIFIVQLSEQAVTLLRSLPRVSDRVFPSGITGRQIDNSTIRKLLIAMHNEQIDAGRDGWIDRAQTERTGAPVVISQHGTARASFMTWCRTGDRLREFDREAVDLCLAHETNDSIDQGYDHAVMEDERRRIMNAWGAWCWSELKL